MAPGPPPSEKMLMRCTSGSAAIFDSAATLRASPLSCASLAPMAPRLRLCWNCAHDSSMGMLAGLSPTSCAIAPAAAPLAGPGTKKFAPLSGSAPGALDSPSGLAATRVFEDGWGQEGAACGTAERAGGPRRQEGDRGEDGHSGGRHDGTEEETAATVAPGVCVGGVHKVQITLSATGKRCVQFRRAFA